MVLVQRQTSCPASYYHGGGGYQLPMGNDGDDNVVMPSYDYGSSYSGYPSPSSSSSASFCKSPSKCTTTTISALPKWVLPVAYAVALISWLSAFQVNGHLARVYDGLDTELQALGAQREESLRFLQDANNAREELQKEKKKLTRTYRLLQHEIRMKDELYESSQNEQQQLQNQTLKTIQMRQSGVAMAWIQQRQQALYDKIFNLQYFIREQSRTRVVEKYGPGPHYVEFTVLPKNTNQQRTFVVELAPLDTVPHSIETFLEMATNGLWDNTVFYHHESQKHVIAAAPVNYGTFDTKHYHFAALGYTGVSYPEYAPSYGHEEYTIGFSGKGPNFYINTMDNREHHGPGGQGHHLLPSDADPCFGKIVSGKSAISDMTSPPHSSVSDPQSWQDFDLTKIVKIELLK